MIAADVSYVNADAEIVTDYNSKNKLLSDATGAVLDAPALAVTINIVDLVYASDLRWSTYSGLLNGAPFNLHAILDDSSDMAPVDDVTITVS